MAFSDSFIGSGIGAWDVMELSLDLDLTVNGFVSFAKSTSAHSTVFNKSGHLINFFLFPFWKKIIDLPGGPLK